MPTYAFRTVLSALILLNATFYAVAIARHQEYGGNFFGGAGGTGIDVYYTPRWALPAAVAVGLLGLVLSALVAPRRAAVSPESPLNRSWS
jgi:hypothetical protein